MSAEQKNSDQNALATRMNQFWVDFKQGKVIGYKVMALGLILIAVIGSTWYILSERRKASSHQWVLLDEANTVSALKELSQGNPNTIQDRLARLQIARNELGVAGIDRLGSIDAELRKKAIENIETARDSFGKLLDEFKNDPVFKAECLLALAKAEAALVAVPAKEGQLTEFKGTIIRLVELLEQLSEAAAPGTPWANDSKKMAESLKDPNSATAHEFLRVEQALIKSSALFGDSGMGNGPLAPTLSPFQSGQGGMPKMPFIKGVPEPVSPLDKGPTSNAPGGPVPPLPPGPQVPDAPKEASPSVAPPPKPADPKAPQTPVIPPPNIPEPKAPSKSPDTTPKAPEPKAPEPKAPIAPPEKKPG
ncbi:MAG TPA: hypothetical protein VG097_14705 [Gemmata sp.]|jgi:hypothetical protein|nr:hypothetical protein [Gemmata sp.]